MAHGTSRFECQADAGEADPRGDVFDTGVDEVPQDGGERQAWFIMPYNGYVYRVGATWPDGANSSVGFNLSVERPDYTAGEDVRELRDYTLDRDQARTIERTVENEGTFMPRNYPNPEFVADDGRWIPFYPVTRIPKAAKVMVTVRNESTSNSMELQTRINTFNFDPRQLQSLPSGGV